MSGNWMGSGLLLVFSFWWTGRERPGRRLWQALSRQQIRAIQWYVGRGSGLDGGGLCRQHPSPVAFLEGACPPVCLWLQPCLRLDAWEIIRL